ncbi:SAM-dependent methyltransferase, partial [Gordonia alkanivorans]|nr:SAM-dependent methyltransferase [Gordonia alkanivorans]
GADSHSGKMSLSEIVETLLGGNLSIRISAYAGSSAGPADAQYGLNQKTPRGTTYLVTAPGDLGMARAYIAG